MTGATALGAGAAAGGGGGEGVSPGGSGGMSPPVGRAEEGRGYRTTTGDRALLLESHRAVVERSRSNSFTMVDVRQKELEEEEESLDGSDANDLKRRRRRSYEAQRCTNPSETAGLVVVEVLPPEGSGVKGKGGKGAGKGDAIEMKAITPAVVLTTHVHDEDVGVMQV